jgi:GxxExxY protein
MDEDEINRRSKLVIDVAMRVHSALGPGCLESAYEACVAYDLRARGLTVMTQVPIAAQYGIVQLDVAYRADLVVDDAIIIELKAVPKLMAVHTAQLLSYLRLGRFKLGMLINFHEVQLKNGIKRVVNGL